MSTPEPLSTGLDRWRGEHGIRVVPDLPDVDVDEVELHEQLGEIVQARNDRRWHRSVPQRFHRAELTDFDVHAPWFDPALMWACRSDMRRNVVIVGPVGTGKTHLAAAMCRPANDMGLDVRLVSIVRLLDELRPGGPDGALDDLLALDRLIVDDVGREKPTDWTAERFDMLVDERWAEDLPTIFTSNMEPKVLAEHVGERCYSRMAGGALGIQLTGTDRRRA